MGILKKLFCKHFWNDTYESRPWECDSLILHNADKSEEYHRIFLIKDVKQICQKCKKIREIKRLGYWENGQMSVWQDIE